MRSGQQNKRGRGRNNSNGNRKGSNPLTRTYDSTGPDVKIRGTAQHIAEKYTQLARDAQGSGDRVIAENYLQHAEHYNRIIAAAQAQLQERHQREERQENADNSGSEEGAGHDGANASSSDAPKAAVDGSGPQPVIEGTPAEVANEEEAQPTRRRPSRPRRQKRPSNKSDEAAAAAPEGDSASEAKPAEDAQPAVANAAE